MVHQGKERHGPFPPCCVERTVTPGRALSILFSLILERTVEAGPGPWRHCKEPQPGTTRDPKETSGGGQEPPGRSQSATTDKTQTKAKGV